MPVVITGEWLAIINDIRRGSGLSPVVDNGFASAAARSHSCYMIENEITHEEKPGRPGYTSEGARAGRVSNLAVSATSGLSDRKMIEMWMSGPFHAIGLLRPNLYWVAYGRCDGNGDQWRSAATLNVLDGIVDGVARPATPIVWPGNGTSTSLLRFAAEEPDPVEECGWKGEAGLPVIAMFQGTVSKPSATMTGPDGKTMQTCVLWHGIVRNSAARTILGGNNAVVVVPRKPLRPGRQTVTVSSSGRSVTWSFTVKS